MKIKRLVSSIWLGNSGPKEEGTLNDIREVGLSFIEEIKKVKKNVEIRISGWVWELDAVCYVYIWRTGLTVKFGI